MSYTPSALQLQREEAKRRASRRSTAIALLSTLLVGAVLTLIVANAQGAEARLNLSRLFLQSSRLLVTMRRVQSLLSEISQMSVL